ncbi:NAD(P)-binding protein [Aspergillus heteromorphus CBS 117.55]|uniref:NAD(P)-binding protein n=1 Tax=Aspergillus heteromorphus CBS 117.55 TaxID=1448321 RepID=A0A317VQF5_9EURO|nr:NAD(P)-binding protein [Aspergillus heteromorphus CBS 117.55]PWY75521.1 NAD(P)-binding protein [Aspergillus heteromorphus CBS 117.55]
MPATTHPEFNDQTEALEVAKAFASSIHGKTILITGVNPGGIGFATAEAFASQSPSHLILAGRTPSKLTASITALRTKHPATTYHALEVDLSNQASVRAAATTLLSWPDIPQINILINNAGIMNLPHRTLTAEGIELTFATNHVGHFLLTCLIMPKILAAAEAEAEAETEGNTTTTTRGATRIINVSALSASIAKMRWSDPTFAIKNKDLPVSEQPNYDILRQWGTPDPEERSYVPVEAYNQSKVANVLFSIGLTRRLLEKYGVLSLALHPGIIETELAREFSAEQTAALEQMWRVRYGSYRSLGAGAATSLVAALDPGLAVGVGERREGKENYGAFLVDCQNV